MIRFGTALPALPAVALACTFACVSPVLADPEPAAGTSQADAAAPETAGLATANTSSQGETKASGEAAATSSGAAPAPAGDHAADTSKPQDNTSDRAAGPNAPASPPTETSALPDSNGAVTKPATDSAATAEAAAAAVDPVVEAIRQKLADKTSLPAAAPEQIEALTAFYAQRSEPLWIKDGKLSAKAGAAIAEIKKADDYGLDATQFSTPELASGAGTEAEANAELKLDVAALKYAHFARGGRIDPLSLSNILDMSPPVKDPADVLKDLAEASEPGVYLRKQNPQQTQFEKLRQALLQARGPKKEEVDEALLVKIPKTPLLRPGDQDPAIPLIRKRLKVDAAPGTNPHHYDAAVALAVEAFQKENGLRPDGVIGSRTRSAMNNEGDAQENDPQRKIDRIIANMERWRWMPRDLGPLYVMNNIPEFRSRILKGDDALLDQKMIVGQPSWPTPVMMATMQTVVFHPSWGVPNGIKMKELLPRLKRASGGNNFFDQLFNGGSSGGGRVLRAYKLNPSLNGRPIDPDSINWNNVDIRRFDFVQPPGSANPLGKVKFMFPNRHDVYMHDTPQRNLFSQSFRALSHGCMRLDEPQRTAEVLLGEDKGWSEGKVDAMYDGSSATIKLDQSIPVYITYFTMTVDKDGKLDTFGDIYGHDQRVVAALTGRSVQYRSRNANDVIASDDEGVVAQPSRKKKNRTASSSRPQGRTPSDILADALSGLVAN